MLALSTSWNSLKRSDAREMLSEIKELGFDNIELGVGIDESKLEQLFSVLHEMGMSVTSVHNFCPLISDDVSGRYYADCYRLSAVDESERKKAVEYTQRTIDTACKLCAKAVVIHAGTIELKENFAGALVDLYRSGRADSEEYMRAKEGCLKMRETAKTPFLRAVTASLEEIMPYAHLRKMKIGLENRYYPDEIPDVDEVGYLLGLFAHLGLGYWHDVGHAEVNERLGISSHEQCLKRYSGNMIGMHIHDLNGINDHAAPFTGDFDYSKIEPYLRNNIIKVIEVNNRVPPAQIKDALLKLTREEAIQ